MRRGRLLYGIQVVLLCSLVIPAFSQQKRNTSHAQPHMTAALQHLKQAQHELEVAAHDKGGHRENALKLIQQAEAEVNKGIEYANIHSQPTEKAPKKKP